MISKLFFV